MTKEELQWAKEALGLSLNPLDGEDVAKLKLAIQACKDVSEKER